MKTNISIWTLVRFVRQILKEAGCDGVKQHFTWSQQQCDIQFDAESFHLCISCLDPKRVRSVIVDMQPRNRQNLVEPTHFTWQQTDLVQDLYSNICDTLHPLLYGETYDC